jgi:hypothetical protein
LASWKDQVFKHFDDVHPALEQDIVVHHPDGGECRALIFDSSQWPYLIKVRNPGNVPGVPSREIPWRVGTGTSSARRADLAAALRPKAPAVTVTVYRLTVAASLDESERPGQFSWFLHGEIYVSAGGREVYLPHRDCMIAIRVPAAMFEVIMDGALTDTSNPSAAIKFDLGGALVKHGGAILLIGRAQSRLPGQQPPGSVRVEIVMTPEGGRPSTVIVEAVAGGPLGAAWGRWDYRHP